MLLYRPRPLDIHTLEASWPCDIMLNCEAGICHALEVNWFAGSYLYTACRFLFPSSWSSYTVFPCRFFMSSWLAPHFWALWRVSAAWFTLGSFSDQAWFEATWMTELKTEMVLHDHLNLEKLCSGDDLQIFWPGRQYQTPGFTSIVHVVLFSLEMLIWIWVKSKWPYAELYEHHPGVLWIGKE